MAGEGFCCEFVERVLAGLGQTDLEGIEGVPQVFDDLSYAGAGGFDGEDDLIRTLHKGDGGYVAEVTVNGYADEPTLWVGVDNGGRVTGLTVRDMAETWGLGRHAMDDAAFLSQFLGSSGHAAVGEDISALAGATVTSRAVARAVNAASAAVTGADLSAGATEWGGG